LNRKALLPHILWVLTFMLAPMALIIYFAFFFRNRFTLSYIKQALTYSGAFLNSINLAFIATAVCLIVGFPAAYIISKIGEKRRNLIILILVLPMWVNFLLRTYAWMSLLENNGILNSFLNIFNINLELINTKKAVIIGMIYDYLPYMIMPIYTVLIKIDKRLIEAAQDLGANRLKVFLKIILPLSAPGIVSGITMVFVPSVSTFIISKMLGGGRDLLIGDIIEMQFLGSAYNPHLGSAISVILMTIVLICMGIMNQVSKNSKNKEGDIII